MKALYFILLLPIFAGCSMPFAQDEQNFARDEIVDTFVPAEEVMVDDEEGTPVVSAEAPPYSIGALLGVEVFGSDFTVGEVLDDNSAYTRYYITYVSEGLTISGIMNVPQATVTNPGPWPVLFLNHGYIDPAVYTNGRGLKREQDYFARRGYVVIHSDYRDHAQSDKSAIRDELGDRGYTRDVLGGIAALKKLNPDFARVDQIGMLGHSMGGGITMNALVAQPILIKAAVLYAPVSSDYKDNFLKWGRNRASAQGLQELENPRKDEDGQDRWNDAAFVPYSAMTYFDRITAPVMIHQGDRDKDVPVQWSRDTLQRLTDAGKDVTYHEYASEGHEFGVQWTTFMERSTTFFDAHLKNEE